MAKKFLTHIDLSGNQLIKASFEKLSTDPGTNLFSGRMYYNTTSKAIKIYDGSTWVGIGEIVSIEGTTNEVTVSVVDGVATIGLPTNIHVDVTGDLTGNASSATNADYATNAGSASYADTAGSATNADYATSAGSATNADYATSAGSATNADYATSAGNATTADSATTAGTANSVAANSVNLGSDTVGDYVAGVSAGTGISISGSGGEGSSVTVTNDDKGSDQSIFKTISSDSGSVAASTNSDTVTIAGGTGIGTSASGSTITVTNNGVTSISGTSDEISVDTSTGSVTLSLPNAVTFPGTVTLNQDPSTDLQAATKQYVDAKVNGLTWKAAANLLWDDSAATLTGSSGTLVIDGHSALTSSNNGYRILISSGTNAGIWEYNDDTTDWTLTRTADADVYTELIGASIFIEEGTLYGKTSWVQANHYITSFAGQNWYQVSGQGTYTAGDGLSLIGGEFAVKTATSGGIIFNGSAELEIDNSYVTTNSGTQTLYDKTLYTPKVLGPIYVQSGGGAGGLNNTITANNSTAVLEIGSGYGVAINATGDVIITPTGSAKIGSDVITTNTASQTLTNKTPVITGDGVVFEGATVNTYQTTLAVVDPTADRTITLPNATGTVALTSDLTGMPTKVSANVGNGSNTSFALSHNLNTRDVQVQVYDNGTYDTVECDVVRTDVDTVTVSFAVAPTSNAYRVVIVG
jgi:hypothetical protein